MVVTVGDNGDWGWHAVSRLKRTLSRLNVATSKSYTAIRTSLLVTIPVIDVKRTISVRLFLLTAWVDIDGSGDCSCISQIDG